MVQEAIGSVHYISPEQAKGSKIDYRTDLYSLGVMMYEMLTGKLPFEGETALQIVMQHINEVPIIPSAFVPGIPKGMDDIVMHAMSAHISRRYESAEKDVRGHGGASLGPECTLPLCGKRGQLGRDADHRRGHSACGAPQCGRA